MTNRRTTLGYNGEQLAARWYEENGYRVLARNWRCARGEIDLVCTKVNEAGCTTLVVCEVKTRSTTSHGHPLEAVTPVKQARLRRLAVLYLRSQDSRFDHIRFDVAAVNREGLHVMERAF